MHATTHRTLTASERIRLARKRVATAKREAERLERIGRQRESRGFDRMMRENGGTL
jgi:hypothetical protein